MRARRGAKLGWRAARVAVLAASCSLSMMGAGTSLAAGADSFPTRPLRLIVPYAPGGNADIVGRLVAEGLGARLGYQVVVDNRPGGSTLIGTALAAKSPPDGYTLVLIANTFAVNQSLVPKLPYDGVKDFVPMSLVATTAQVLVVTPAIAASTVKEFIALARSKPGALNYGSTGVGSSANMAGALLNLMAGIHLVHVPYKGTAQALTEVMAGHLHVAIPSITSSAPHVRSGKIRPLGVTGLKRSAQLPDVPTIAEAAVPGYQAVIWNGVLAPAGTPGPILERLSREIATAMRSPEISARYASMGADTIGSTPHEFARFLKEEIEQYARVVKAGGLKDELTR